MIDFPGRKLVNLLVPRQGKEFLFRAYNLSGRILNNSKNSRNYPRNLAICLTTRCNLRCTICDRKDFMASDMNFENIIKLRNPIKYAKMIDLTGWGEAILYERYEDVVKYIFSFNNRKKLISQTTNGMLAYKYGDSLKGRLRSLVISLNAATPQTYNREMKNGNFDKTIASVKTLLAKLTNEDKKAVKLHFVSHVNNYKEMPLFVELAKSLNISQVSFGQYMSSGPYTDPNTLLNIKEEYNNILKRVDEKSRKFGVEVFYRRFGEKLGFSPQNCRFPHEWCFVLTNGEVTPCCYLADTSMGNIFENSFESVWQGGYIQKLRKSRYLPLCSACAPFHQFDDPVCHSTAKYNLEKIEERIRK